MIDNTTNEIEIFIVRHGRSLGQDDLSMYKRLGDCHIPLTETGILQSLAVGKFLQQYADLHGIDLSAIFNSTCTRAAQTAENIQKVLLENNFIPRYSDDRINKQRFGVLDGLFSEAERQRVQPEAFADFRRQLAEKGLYHAKPRGGESIRDVFVRSNELLSETLQRPQPTIVVTHGLVALCIEQALLGHSEEWVLQNMDKMENCSVRRIYGSIEKGFKAETICDNPLQWQIDRESKFHGSKRHFV